MIEVKNLSKSFNDTWVLRDISLSVPQGQVVTIIGPSGSGKSTFLRCLNFLSSPTTGKIIIDGEDITRSNFNLCYLREKVGMVFQHFNLFPHMTVQDNVMYAPMKVKGYSRSEAHDQAMALLDRVGLKNKALSYPNRLSGGQKQRVAIARSLAMNPEVILFDEPTSALDPEMVKEVLNVIQSLTNTNITMVIVTHEMNFARNVAQRILFMDHGVILEDSLPEAFFNNPQSSRARQFLDNLL